MTVLVLCRVLWAAFVLCVVVLMFFAYVGLVCRLCPCPCYVFRIFFVVCCLKVCLSSLFCLFRCRFRVRIRTRIHIRVRIRIRIRSFLLLLLSRPLIRAIGRLSLCLCFRFRSVGFRGSDIKHPTRFWILAQRTVKVKMVYQMVLVTITYVIVIVVLMHVCVLAGNWGGGPLGAPVAMATAVPFSWVLVEPHARQGAGALGTLWG